MAFNLGGHINHSVFWKNMSPEGGQRPEGGELSAAIDEYFGSFEGFKKQFSAVANGLQGSGWAVLGYDHIEPKDEREMFALQNEILADWYDDRRAAGVGAHLGQLAGDAGDAQRLDRAEQVLAVLSIVSLVLEQIHNR